MRRCSYLLSLSISALLIFGGCSDGDTGGSGGSPDAGAQDTGNPPGQFKETNNPPATPPTDKDKIDFVTAFGDDNMACKGTDRCTIWMNYLGQRQLKVVATRGGVPIENLILDWEVVTNPNSSLSLSSSQTFTVAQGLGENLAKQDTTQNGVYSVRVSINGSDAPALFFDISVSAKGQVPLIVHYLYTGNRQFEGITTYLFKQAPDKQYLCKDIDADLKNLTATLSKGPTVLNQSVQFAQLPGLAEEGSQKFTVVGIGKNANGPAIVMGCDSTHAIVTQNGSVTVNVTLNDEAHLWKNSYDVTTEFDVVSVLPENVKNVIDIILGLFQDPAGQLLVLACDFSGQDSFLADMCNAVFKDPENPSLEDKDFTGLGLTIKGFMNQLLTELLKDNVGGDIFFTGQDIANILKRLRMTATMSFINEPQSDGTFTVEDTNEEWHTVHYRWTLGSGCDPSDDSCGWYTFSFQVWNSGETVQGNFAGNVETTSSVNDKGQAVETIQLNIDQHPLHIKYGALLLHVIEKEILPKATADDNPNAPVVDSLEKLVKSLMGGKMCLIDDTCCENFANSASGSSTGGFTKTVAKAACEALVSIGIDQLKTLLVNQELDTDGAFTIGTKSGCQCYDQTQNMKIDAWGSKTEPCEWNAEIKVPNYTTQIDNKFWGVRQP